jgi:hypothetical protein
MCTSGVGTSGIFGQRTRELSEYMILVNSLEKEPGTGPWRARTISRNDMERAMGIEPTSEAWEASILPLYDARSLGLNAVIIHKRADGGTGSAHLGSSTIL